MQLGTLAPGSVGAADGAVAFLVLLAVGAVVWAGVLVVLVRALARRFGARTGA